jgi:hypothetical protein
VEPVAESEGEVLLRRDVLANMLTMYQPYAGEEQRRAFQARNPWHRRLLDSDLAWAIKGFLGGTHVPSGSLLTAAQAAADAIADHAGPVEHLHEK